MTRLSPTQVAALNHACVHGGVNASSGFTRATIGALKSYGLMAYSHITAYDTWSAHLTPSGQAWIRRNAPERQEADARSVALRAEYRHRAAKYLADAKTALEWLSRGDSTVARAVAVLATVTHPAKSPAKVEDAGWWLTDNNRAGWAYEIGSALKDIGEKCGRTAYPVEQRDLDRLAEHEATMAECETAFKVN